MKLTMWCTSSFIVKWQPGRRRIPAAGLRSTQNHQFLFPFSSKFPDPNFASHVLYIYPCGTHSEPGLPVQKGTTTLTTTRFARGGTFRSGTIREGSCQSTSGPTKLAAVARFLSDRLLDFPGPCHCSNLFVITGFDYDGKYTDNKR